MTKLARSEIYFGRQITLDEILADVDGVQREDAVVAHGQVARAHGRVHQRPPSALAITPVSSRNIDM